MNKWRPPSQTLEVSLLFPNRKSPSLICHHQLLLFKQWLVFENNPPSIDEIGPRQAAARLCQNLFQRQVFGRSVMFKAGKWLVNDKTSDVNFTRLWIWQMSNESLADSSMFALIYCLCSVNVFHLVLTNVCNAVLLTFRTNCKSCFKYETEIDAIALYSASSYPLKMPCVMSCNIWQNDLNLKGYHWCQQQVNTKLQMCIDCLDAPGDTMPAERTFVYLSNFTECWSGTKELMVYCLCVCVERWTEAKW